MAARGDPDVALVLRRALDPDLPHRGARHCSHSRCQRAAGGDPRPDRSGVPSAWRRPDPLGDPRLDGCAQSRVHLHRLVPALRRSLDLGRRRRHARPLPGPGSLKRSCPGPIPGAVATTPPSPHSPAPARSQPSAAEWCATATTEVAIGASTGPCTTSP